MTACIVAYSPQRLSPSEQASVGPQEGWLQTDVMVAQKVTYRTSSHQKILLKMLVRFHSRAQRRPAAQHSTAHRMSEHAKALLKYTGL